MTAAKRELNVVHCVRCGTGNNLFEGSGAVPVCLRCGEVTVEALPLLGAIGLWSGDMAACPSCQTKNGLWHPGRQASLSATSNGGARHLDHRDRASLEQSEPLTRPTASPRGAGSSLPRWT